VGTRVVRLSDYEGRKPVYIGVGTVLLILVIVLLIAFVF
jgi:hypothetical protein